MLAPAHRMTGASQFATTVREGRRRGTTTLVAHVRTTDRDTSAVTVGLVVSKAVGNAVTRNRVKRRLRHLAAARLDRFPPGSSVVLRALPASSGASSSRLGRDLDHALDRLLPRAVEAGT